MGKAKPAKAPTTNMYLRLNNATLRQLKAEAQKAGKPPSTYIRHLLEAYAPPPDGAELHKKADKLRRAALISEL